MSGVLIVKVKFSKFQGNICRDSVLNKYILGKSLLSNYMILKDWLGFLIHTLTCWTISPRPLVSQETQDSRLLVLHKRVRKHKCTLCWTLSPYSLYLMRFGIQHDQKEIMRRARFIISMDVACMSLEKVQVNVYTTQNNFCVVCQNCLQIYLFK